MKIRLSYFCALIVLLLPVVPSHAEPETWGHYFNAGVQALEKDQKEEAIILFGKAGEVAKTPAEMASVASNLAVIYRMQKRYPLAALMANRAAKITQDAYGPFHPDTMMEYANLGNIYVVMGEDDKAYTVLMNVLKAAKENKAETSLAAANALYGLATMYERKGELGTAIAMQEAFVRVCQGSNESKLKALLPNAEKKLSDLRNKKQ